MSGKTGIAEYYFEYSLQRVSGDESVVKEPKIYFERDYGKQDLSYSMYTVPEEWLDQQNLADQISDNRSADSIAQHLEQLPYDKVSVVFDIMGTECAPLVDRNSREYKSAEIKKEIGFLAFQKNACRFFIERENAKDRAGVGVIEMKKTVDDGEETVARFFFAVNFCVRKKIEYIVKLEGKRLNMVFRSSDRPEGLMVGVACTEGRLPCLKNDTRVSALGETFVLDFSADTEFRKSIQLEDDQAARGNMFQVFFKRESDERYYMLDCRGNNTIPQEKPRETMTMTSTTCPFCHQKMNGKLVTNENYKRGGVACHPLPGASRYPVIYSDHDARLKNCLYCADDLSVKDGTAFFKSDYMRLLPAEFLEHDFYKIAFSGSTRAGKTTYLSRFFGISGGQKINMPMTAVANSLNKMGISIKNAPLNQVKVKKAPPEYQVEDHGWSDETPMYLERSVNLNPPRFPMATPGGDYTAYPFVAEISDKTRKSYVSFYDIAGEDSEHETQVRRVANNERIGVFCFINGISDVQKHGNVIQKLLEADLDADCPIAMIITKMDALQDEFDPNCHCLRTDYVQKIDEYTGSALEKEINFASEEIRSYLSQKSLLSNMSQRFNNVKFFAVSAFNFKDSIHSEGELDNTEGHLKFECSSKRLELPFVWMLKQFGIIK